MAQTIVARLLELNELQAERAVDADQCWPEHVETSVLEGFSEYMVLRTLERHSDESRELLRLCPLINSSASSQPWPSPPRRVPAG